MSLTERNKEIARRWMELVSSHDVEAICEMTSPTWTMHGGPPALPAGPNGVRKLFAAMGSVEQTWTIDDIVAEGEKVVVRATNICVQDSFLGLPGRGLQQRFSAMFMHWIVAGKVHETWRNADDLGRVLQLGGRLESEATEP
jgi:hypothetical protein